MSAGDQLRKYKQRLQENEQQLSKMTEAHGQLNDQLARVYSDVEGQKAIITAHEKTIGDLERKLRIAENLASNVGLMATDNHRLAMTLDNVAAMGAALVPKPNANLTPRS